MPNLQEIVTGHSVSSLRKTRSFAIILLWASEGVGKPFRETVYKWDKEEKNK